MAAASTPPREHDHFRLLEDCHAQIGAHLDRLAALMDHLDAHGVDRHAQDEARSIEAFFSSTAQRHHLDEETKVFPALLTSGDAKLVASVRMLQQDHGWIEEDWLAIGPQLSAIASGYHWHDPAELRHALQVFLELCREHIALEETLIYPEAKERAAKLQRRRATLPPLRFTAAAPSSS